MLLSSVLSLQWERLPYFFRAGLLVTNSQLFTWEYLTLSFIFEGKYFWIQNSWWTVSYFPPFTLNTSSQCLWLLWLLIKNKLLIWLKIPCVWWVTSFLLLLESLFIFRQVDYDESICGSFWGCPKLEFVKLFLCIDCFSSNVKRVQLFSFFNILLIPFSPLSFWGLPLCVCWHTWCCATGLLRLCRYFFILFSFCSSDWIISVELSPSHQFFLLPAQIGC